MLTNRLKPLLAEVIGKQQTGYIPGRFIGTNLRKMRDLIRYIECNEMNAVLMNVDFEKCFDSISHEALIETLKLFKVPEYYISWIRMLYNNFELCVINNGRWHGYFPQRRGVHQGSALSCPLFLYLAELLVISIHRNQKIRGVKVDNTEEKLEQYADDTSIWSRYEEESLNEIIDKLENFYCNTGLKANFEKTTLYKIGDKTKFTKRLYLKKKFKWGKNAIDTLGLMIVLENEKEMTDLNYEAVLQKASNVLSSWQNRNLSLVGKIEVNTLVNSLFVYKKQVLPTMPKETESCISLMISRYIWNGRKPKIRNENLQCKSEEGGLRLADMKLRDSSLKIE